ncbi:phage tail protein [Microbacterium cremeum]|uniref:phage tail protein n=1 Tax=Microbacterium cremeum TaxID=2782169 RepID=UPI001887496A|nr:phage tail protein [Microbacterium cremeum]
MRADRIARLLPDVYRRAIVPGTPLAALVDVMAEQHAPVEQALADLPDYFDPQRAPDHFVPFLAHWVDLARWLDDASGEFDTGPGRLRQVVAGAAALSRRRGTARGLREALEWATGVAGVRVEETAPVPTPSPHSAGALRGASGREGPAGGVGPAGGRGRRFHARVVLPHAASAYEPLVRRIVEQEKPAHVTVEIVFEDATPSGPDGPGATGGTEASEVPEPPEPPTLPVEAPPAPPEPAFPGTERLPVISHAPAEPPPLPPGAALAEPITGGLPPSPADPADAAASAPTIAVERPPRPDAEPAGR